MSKNKRQRVLDQQQAGKVTIKEDEGNQRLKGPKDLSKPAEGDAATSEPANTTETDSNTTETTENQ